MLPWTRKVPGNILLWPVNLSNLTNASMRNALLFTICCMVSVPRAYAQQIPHKINIGAGHAFLGTGDLSGYTVFTELEVPFQNSGRFSWSPGLQFSNHATTTYLTNGFEHRAITSGIAAWLKLDYAVLLSARHRITIGAGPSLRFQSDSQPTSIDGRLEPSGVWVTDISYEHNLNTLSPGYLIAPQYQYMISKRVALGLRVMLQNDTRGDVMASQVIMAAVNL
jgi:hypothetical protein